MTTGIGNEWDPGDSQEIHNEPNIRPEVLKAGDELTQNLNTSLEKMLPTRQATQLYSRADICTLLGMNHSTLARWEQKGLISSPQRINNVCVYSEEQFQEIKTVWESSNRNLSNAQLCSSCHERKARANSTLCSRCSYSSLETQLRSTLPGMVQDEHNSADTNGTSSDNSLDQQDDEPLTCPTCSSDDPHEKNNVTTGPEEFPITLECSDDWHNCLQSFMMNKSGTLTPGVKYYSRRDLADAVGVSPTTICRWEQKGHIPPPFRVAHSNQLYYTEDHLTKAKEFYSLVEQVKTSPVAQAAKVITSKTFSKISEKAVSLKIGKGAFRRGGLL